MFKIFEFNSTLLFQGRPGHFEPVSALTSTELFGIDLNVMGRGPFGKGLMCFPLVPQGLLNKSEIGLKANYIVHSKRL